MEMKEIEVSAILALIIGWLLLIGFIGPWLLSAESDIAVTGGVIAILAAAYGTYRFVKSKLTSEGEAKNELS